MFTTIRLVLGNAWGIISEPNDKNSQVALAIGVIVVATLLAVVAAFFFGVFARSDGFANRFAGGFVALLGCVGAFSVGGMLGLLFGSPTWGSGQPAATSASTAASGGEQPRVQIAVRPNTSLERIAEWLTTMIVGLGLVNLGAIKTEAATLSVWLTQAITDNESSNGTPGITIALGFSFAGFLLVYLWSMRFLPSELRDSYDELKARVEDAEAKNRRLMAEFKEKADFTVPAGKIEQLRAILSENHVEPELCAEVVGRYKAARRADSEPMQEFGPHEASGFQLTATVTEAGPGKYDVVVRLTAQKDTAAAKVFWLLHNSFTPDVMSECPIKPGEDTTYSTKVDEAFWVGAVVPIPGHPSVKLALSLREIPGVPRGFLGE